MNTPSERGILFDIQRFCLHDGPGIRTTLFLKGCPLRCAWCHNPESQSPDFELSFHGESCIGCGACKTVCRHDPCVSCFACVEVCPTGAREKIGYEITAADAIDVALRDRPFYTNGGGVTLSGGEPFFQPKFTLSLLQAAKANGLHTAIETSGAARPEDLIAALPYTDLFLFDIKMIPGAEHKRFVGCDGFALHDHLRMLDRAGAKTVLRCPIIPGVNGNTAHFDYIAALAAELTHLTEIDLEPYHTAGISKAKDLGRTDVFTVKDYRKNEWKQRIADEFLPRLSSLSVPIILY